MKKIFGLFFTIAVVGAYYTQPPLDFFGAASNNGLGPMLNPLLESTMKIVDSVLYTLNHTCEATINFLHSTIATLRTNELILPLTGFLEDHVKAALESLKDQYKSILPDIDQSIHQLIGRVGILQDGLFAIKNTLNQAVIKTKTLVNQCSATKIGTMISEIHGCANEAMTAVQMEMTATEDLVNEALKELLDVIAKKGDCVALVPKDIESCLMDLTSDLPDIMMTIRKDLTVHTDVRDVLSKVTMCTSSITSDLGMLCY